MENPNVLLVAGTDKGVGKTVLTSALAAYWQRFHPQKRLSVLKPIQIGGGDRELYQRLFFPETALDEITPQYFSAPLAPPLAAAQENRSVDLATIWRRLSTLMEQTDWVVLEAFGGLGSPVTDELTLADLAAAWKLPVLLTVPVRLGAIAQAVANVALARQQKVALRGLVLNCLQPCSDQDIDQWAPCDLLQRLTQVPVLGCLPHLENPENLDDLVKAAAALNLEAIAPLGIPVIVG